MAFTAVALPVQSKIVQLSETSSNDGPCFFSMPPRGGNGGRQWDDDTNPNPNSSCEHEKEEMSEKGEEGSAVEFDTTETVGEKIDVEGRSERPKRSERQKRTTREPNKFDGFVVYR